MNVNKKVKNATSIVSETGIKFKSKLELFTYTLFLKNGIELKYEEETFTLMEGFEYEGRKYRPITYTPDFGHPILPIIIEVKGFANDAFPLRWKLFCRYLKLSERKVDVFIVKNQKQVAECLQQIMDSYSHLLQ